jgi:hypothetical protein
MSPSHPLHRSEVPMRPKSTARLVCSVVCARFTVSRMHRRGRRAVRAGVFPSVASTAAASATDTPAPRRSMSHHARHPDPYPLPTSPPMPSTSPPQARGIRCSSCGRLLCLQIGASLHIKRKDFEGGVVGRVDLRCRCGVSTVVVTVTAPASSSPSAS